MKNKIRIPFTKSLYPHRNNNTNVFCYSDRTLTHDVNAFTANKNEINDQNEWINLIKYPEKRKSNYV